MHSTKEKTISETTTQTTTPKKTKATKKSAKPTKPAKAKKAAKPKGTRSGSKAEKVLELMKRKEGATLAEIAKATDWQNHGSLVDKRLPGVRFTEAICGATGRVLQWPNISSEIKE